MDTPTQALLGAVVGQACFSHSLGRRALWWGALGGAIPDLDFVPVAFLGPWGEFLYHRGPTHSLWFGPVVGSLLGYAVWRGYAARGSRKGAKRHPESAPPTGDSTAGLPGPGLPGLLPSWIGLFVLTLLTHPLLDVFTTYGTQLFAPFSDRRFSLDAVPIIDPLYSLILIAALAVWSLAPPGRRTRLGRQAASVALVLSTAYLFYGLWLNVRAEQEVRSQIASEGMSDARVRAYPTLLQVYLRRIVVRADNDVLVGSITMWKPGPVRWHRFTIPEHPMIRRLAETKEGWIFHWFADREVAPRVIEREDGFVVEFDDLRYGFFQEPERGIWGIRARFSPEGNLQGDVVRFNRPFEVRADTFFDLWRAAFGLIPEAPGLVLSKGPLEKGSGSPPVPASKEN